MCSFYLGRIFSSPAGRSVAPFRHRLARRTSTWLSSCWLWTRSATLLLVLFDIFLLFFSVIMRSVSISILVVRLQPTHSCHSEQTLASHRAISGSIVLVEYFLFLLWREVTQINLRLIFICVFSIDIKVNSHNRSIFKNEKEILIWVVFTICTHPALWRVF